MSMTDPIADLLTRIRNAQLARKTEVSVSSSKLKQALEVGNGISHAHAMLSLPAGLGDARQFAARNRFTDLHARQAEAAIHAA